MKHSPLFDKEIGEFLDILLRLKKEISEKILLELENLIRSRQEALESQCILSYFDISILENLLLENSFLQQREELFLEKLTRIS